jgi:hypothetical protein
MVSGCQSGYIHESGIFLDIDGNIYHHIADINNDCSITDDINETL